MRRVLCMLLLLFAFTPAVAQDEVEPEPEPEAPAEPKGSLRARPDKDPAAAGWVSTLGTPRPRALTVAQGPMLRAVLSPDGERFYYYRSLPREGKAPQMYALYCVGPEKSEGKVADTGVDAHPPLFLADGRILFTTRRHDLNHDDVIDELDDCTLVVSNRDGGNLRHAATLAAGETPVATWRGGREVLLAVPSDDEVSGWITSLDLVTGARTQVVRGFNVALVLEGDKLLIERMQSTPKPREPMRWGRDGPLPPEDEGPPPPPSLLDHVEYLVFDPAEAEPVPLYKPSRKSRVLATGEGSYFGVQERDPTSSVRGNPFVRRAGSASFEILVIDDVQHRDTRSLSARFNYEVLAWIDQRGLLLVERGNLGARLYLMDRALKFHKLADFDLAATDFTASRDGLTVGWLEVEDTDENGLLQPWKDNARPHILRLR